MKLLLFIAPLLLLDNPPPHRVNTPPCEPVLTVTQWQPWCVSEEPPCTTYVDWFLTPTSRSCANGCKATLDISVSEMCMTSEGPTVTGYGIGATLDAACGMPGSPTSIPCPYGGMWLVLTMGCSPCE